MFPLLIQILAAVRDNAKLLTTRKEPVLLVALGAAQIMVGLFVVGLEVVAQNKASCFYGGVYFLGALYITCGIVSFLWHPSVWWVVFTAFVNLLTVAWTMVGVAVYVVDLRFTRFEGPHVAQEIVTRVYMLSMALTLLQMCICIISAVICIREMRRREREEVLKLGQVGEGSQESKEAMTGPGA